MTEVIGYIALITSFIAMLQNSIVRLRWLHLMSSTGYIIYGLNIQAFPIVIGAIAYCVTHFLKLVKYYKKK